VKKQIPSIIHFIISKLCVATLTVATIVFGFWPQTILALLR
jgi:hypothetical protein